MISCTSGSRLLLVSLDGMSLSQLAQLSSVSTAFKGVLSKLVETRDVRCTELVNSQSAWSELLTGRPWSELGCPGYCRPKDSLNDLEIVCEDALSLRSELTEPGPGLKFVFVNVPLLKPKAGRIWLSDGSLPIQTTVSPTELSKGPPFNAYRPRPYASATVALSEKQSSLSTCLSIERQRIECASELIALGDWNRFFLRLSVFDQLAHLLGADNVISDELVFSAELQSFWQFVGDRLASWIEASPEITLVLLSTFSHVPCRARLNLNELLAVGGFCVLARSDSEKAQLDRRMAATLAISKASGQADLIAFLQPAVSKTCSFDLLNTFAASPIEGAIYINRKTRFAGGIVEDEDAGAIVEKVCNYLQSYLSGEFGTEFKLQKVIDGHERAPDLLVRVPGVELHNSLGPPLLDRNNHPRSTHEGSGFVGSTYRLAGLPSPAYPMDLHKLLIGVLP